MNAPDDSLTLIGVFLMGLGLNLTPCVYPMLSVTISLFEEQKETSTRKAFFKALTYVLGIATMYSALGVAAAFTGGIFGGFLQNKFVLIGAALLITALALSMFGLYTFQMPAWMLEKASGVRKSLGILGIYLSGLVVGVFAAPCIGPPIITLLAWISGKGDPVFAFLVFFILSMGLGLPYLVLGTFSGFLKKLPRSGVWLVWVERFFGVILMSIALSYLMLALAPDWIKWFLPASLFFGGLYLGFFERSHVYPAGFERFKKIVGSSAMIAAILIPLLGPKEAVIWESYAPEKLTEAKNSGQPVIMDFYADWCIPCHELDAVTYTNKQVIVELEKWRRIKVDLTQADSDESSALMEKFQIEGVPTILFIDPTGEEVEALRAAGFLSPGELLTIIRNERFKVNRFSEAEDLVNSDSK